MVMVCDLAEWASALGEPRGGRPGRGADIAYYRRRPEANAGEKAGEKKCGRCFPKEAPPAEGGQP